MAVTTGNYPKSLQPGVMEWFGYLQREHKPQWVHLVETKTSRKNFEEIVQDTDLGLASTKTEGDGVSYVTTQQGYTTRATHVVYGIGMAVTREQIEDNLYMEIGLKNTKKVFNAMHNTKETVVANMYNRAFNSSYTFGDGKELCATDHPHTLGGTFSNELATPATLSETSLEDLTIQIAKAESDAGNPMRVMPKCLIVHPNEMYNAYRILNSILRVDTANNDPNAIKDMNVIPDGVKVNNYLDDSNNWFVRTDVTEGGLMLIQRRPLEFTQDNDFDTENFKMKATERYVTTCANPHALYGSAPA